MTTKTDEQIIAAAMSGHGVLPVTLADLAEPTPAEEIRERVAYGKHGPQKNPDGSDKMLAYVTARFVQERLDSVVGPANWQTRFEDTPGGTRCGIGINVDGEWVWKWDVGIPSNIEPVKGSHSDAYKRAAVQWGIGRDLYEERDEPNEPVAEAPVRAAVGAGRATRYQQGAPAAAPADGDWVCPVHGLVKEVPAGVSKRTGKRYSAFLACPEYGCDETFRPE